MSRKILIVEDNMINRQLLVNTLRDDYEIIESSDGKEALSVIDRCYKMLSAVLLDILMPELDGYEVLRKVRSNILLSQIPIIMVTSLEDEESRTKALSLGANDFITKPFNPEIVKHCLKNNIALCETSSTLNAIRKDKLTGLYNREAFFEKAELMIKDKEPGYYILSNFDIDNFKFINDQYGVLEGDRILKETAAAVKANADAVNGIAARMSADNFAALFPVSKKNTDVLRRIENNSFIFLERQPIAFSIGRYIVSDMTLSVSAMYDRAGIAKESVKGHYNVHVAYFDEKMREKLLKERQIKTEMASALLNNEVKVWFQPQYDHANGTPIGAEALARWHHPQNGIMSPADFIPVFEQTGFIYELDKYVWRKTCSYLREWIDKGYNPPPISVNVSKHDILMPDMIDVITNLINEYEIPVELLCLEITEAAFSSSSSMIIETVKQLINYGFTVEIDDFGSGHASLNTLKNVPAQIVKLDMRFLDDIESVERGSNILQSIVRMTKWLGMTVLAEGVEDKEQADFLKSIGCTYIQGYLYSRPMPASDYEELLISIASGDDRPSDIAVGNVYNRFVHMNEDADSSESLWDMKSLDAFIFSNYAGGACIYEYHDGHMELIRAADKYVSIVFGSEMTADLLMNVVWENHIDQKSAVEFKRAMEESIESKQEVLGEYLFYNLPKCPHETYLRSYIRVIASVGSSRLVYCISENITELREAEKAEKEAISSLQAMAELLRISEDESRLATEHSKNLICKYNVADMMLTIPTNRDAIFELPSLLEDVPYGQVGAGVVSPETSETYISFFESIMRGEKTGEAVFQIKSSFGWHWFEAHFSTVFLDNGLPVSAIVSLFDIEEILKQEKEYKKYPEQHDESISIGTERNLTERTEQDSLTGLLNRASFTEKAEHLILESKPDAHHALLMLDIDGFKSDNDALGKRAKEQMLVDVAEALHRCLDRKDIYGRLGEDEFAIFLRDVPEDIIVSNKANQICELIRKPLSSEIQISVSIGIAVFPRDGTDFRSLYDKASATLYYVKGSGKNNYAFYHEYMGESDAGQKMSGSEAANRPRLDLKRRMLIVEEGHTVYDRLKNVFKNDFVIEKVSDANAALIRLRHYGSAISVVLLNLSMTGIDSFSMLEKMQANMELRSVPVIAISSDNNLETNLKAIRCGASDCILVSAKKEELSIRVQSVIRKAENERFRAKNSFLEQQSSEIVRYKTILDRTGTVVIEHDWGKRTFTYSLSASDHLAGKYDDRTLWHILLSDMVTDVNTARKMQEYMHDIAKDRSRTGGSMTVRMKTSEGKLHWFRMNVYKIVNEYQLTDKLILTFNDIDEDTK